MLVLIAAAAIAVGSQADLTTRADAASEAHVSHFQVRSPFAPGRRTETLVVPRQWRRGGPLLLWLHARGSDENSVFSPAFFAALRSLGRRAPAIVIPSDDRYSFWHDRRDASWGRYVMETVLPRALRLTGANPGRVAVGGISMGGFGAYNLARLHPRRFCVVGGHSAALFDAAARKLPGAFDDRADFARNDLLRIAARDPRAFAGPRSLWVDVGRSDPFASADQRFAQALRRAGLPLSLHVWPGRHAGAYWRSHWAAYFRFYANGLAACGTRR
jgi:S-formylglutathione hydrolase FrmB